MKYLYYLVCLFLVGVLVAFSPADVPAGTVGKLNGVVADASGAPLPGANVVIQGTRRGATTDAEGYFLILSVEPGRYKLEASMVGYTAATKQDVVVRADFTTTVDFNLVEAALQAEELVVIAERPPVEPDRTFSRYVVDAEDIENVPLARTLDEVIALQPGVSLDGNLRIRGSNNASMAGSNDTFVEIDGVRLVNNDGFVAPTWMGINKSALQEVQVVTGGMEAEYGNAQAGVISLVTKEGRDAYTGFGEYRLDLPAKRHWGPNIYDHPFHAGKVDWSDPAFTNETDPETGRKVHERTDYTGVFGHYLEGSASGPIAKDVSFFVNAAHSRKAPIYPSALNREPFNIQTFGNFVTRPSPNFKVKLGGVFAYYEGFDPGTRGSRRIGGSNTRIDPDDPFAGQQLDTDGGVRGITRSGRNLFLPEGYSAAGKQNFSERMAYLLFTHTLSPTTFYEVRLNWQQTLTDTSDVPPVTEGIRRDSKGYFLPRDIYSFKYMDNKRVRLKADLSSQVTKGHFVKTGFEITRYGLYHHEEGSRQARAFTIRLAGGSGDPIIGMERAHPIQYGIYIQDKMEFEGLVINAGIRFDAMDPVKGWRNIATLWMFRHYESLTRFRNMPVTEDLPILHAWSPRIGVSHPITDRSTIRFFTGVFRQFPDIQNFYQREFGGTGEDRDVNGNGQIDQREKYNSLKQFHHAVSGMSDIEPEKSTSFEAGFDWNFAGEYVASVTAFYRDQMGIITNGSTSWRLEEPAFGYDGVSSRGSGNRGRKWSRGFEVSLRKQFSNMVTFNVAYNLAWTKNMNNSGFRNWRAYHVVGPSYVMSDRYFVGVDARADGQEVPHAPTQEERVQLAERARDQLRDYDSRIGEPLSDGYWNAPVEILEPGIYAYTIGRYNTPTLQSGIDRRNILSGQFLFSSPSDFHIAPLASLRISLLYRLHTGIPFNYTPPTGPQERRTGPISLVSDINLEKEFYIGGTMTATAFLEIRNLWNDKADMTTGFDWIQWGKQMPDPDNGTYLKYGDGDIDRYDQGLGRYPRNWVVGARLKF